MTKNLLIVEDSELIRGIVGELLREAGYDVQEAVDGLDALSKLDGRIFHLIISDLNMPNLDGIAFVKRAKQLPAYQCTPIIMFSLENSEAKKAEGSTAGVKAWLNKPIHPGQMLAEVARLAAP